MAFKMTPGLKGSPSKMFGGECGGAGQPPCPPRFQAEKEVMQNMRAADRSFDSRSKSAKRKKARVSPPQQAPVPIKLQLNLPKGYEFQSKFQKASFYDFFSDLSGYKTQEALDKAVIKKLKAPVVVAPGPQLPQLPQPELPGGPVFEGPKEGPIKEGPKAVPVKGVAAVKAK